MAFAKFFTMIVYLRHCFIKKTENYVHCPRKRSWYIKIFWSLYKKNELILTCRVILPSCYCHLLLYSIINRIWLVFPLMIRVYIYIYIYIDIYICFVFSPYFENIIVYGQIYFFKKPTRRINFEFRILLFFLLQPSPFTIQSFNSLHNIGMTYCYTSSTIFIFGVLYL